MKKKNTIKNIFIGFFVVLVLLIAYAAMNGGEGENGESGTSTLTSLLNANSLGQIQDTDTALANAEILRILGSIKDIKLEADIFDDPLFRELQDGGFIIPNPRTIGRPNPFLPIGFNSFSTPSQSSINNQSDVDTNFESTDNSQTQSNEATDFFAETDI